MSIAAKHMDPVVGVDTHIIMIPTPTGPIPTPLPNPFVGMVMDPFDYAPVIGATVYINGMPRAQAGTGCIAMPPHLPLGGPFGPPPPANEGEIFMGSSTVAVDGDAQSFLGLPVLSCQSIGMPAPPRPKGQPPKSLVLPTSTVLSIPMGPLVLIGGPPTISIMAMGMKAAMGMLGKLGGALRKLQRGDGLIGDAMRGITAKARAAGEKVAKTANLGPKGQQRVNDAICTVTGHPVDVATGRVFADKTDLELAAPLPFVWKRSWSSTSTYRGDLGHGWHHNYQHALYFQDDVVLYRNEEGRAISFPPLKQGQEYFDRTERLTLIRDPGERGGGYALRSIDRLTYRFEQRGLPNGEQVLVSVTDRVGNRTALNRDARGRLAGITDSAGRILQLTHDREGHITAITAPHPDPDAPGKRFVVVQYGYDARGNLAHVIDALGQSASYTYDHHLLTKETDRKGLSFYFEYDGKDANAKCIRTWGDGGIYDHKLRYDDRAGLTWVENSLGHTTQYRHKGGLVVEVTDALGAVTLTEYDEYNQKVKETDPLGNVTTWAYDERGNTTEVVGPDGATLKMAYGQADKPDADRPTEATDSVDGIWTWSYDDKGRLVQRVDPLGAATRFIYQGTELATLVDAHGHATGLTYDQQGLLSGLHAADGGTSRWQYDPLGRAVAATDAHGNVQRRHFDLLGRVTRIEEPDGNLRELGYDAEGNIVRAKDRQHDVSFTYRGMGRMASRSEADTTVRFEYDSEEQLTGIVNEHGHVYRFQLGPTGEVATETGFDGLLRSYKRDAAGRVIRVERPDERFSEYAYDKAGQVVAVHHSDGCKESYAYRLDGELMQATNDAIAVGFERDALGRITKETQGPHWVASEYDALGLRSSMQSSMGAEQSIERNQMGDVVKLAHGKGQWQATFGRDLLGLELDRQLPGGIHSRWERDKLGRPVKQEVFAGAEIKRALSYKWDVNDRLRMVIDAMKGPTQYGHDALGNLAWAQYAEGGIDLRMPDAVGNLFRTRERMDRKYGPAGQLLESRDRRGRITRYKYDPEGNLKEKHEPSGRTWRYTWNGAGMLAEVQRPDGSQVTFQYDALGRRVSKSYRGRTTHWVWDGNNPLHEWTEGELELASAASPALGPADLQDEDAAEIAKRDAELSELLAQGPPIYGTRKAPITWLFEPETFAPAAKLVGDQQFSIITDHLGTPVAMFAGGGEQVWSADIGVWGQLRNLQGPRHACPFRWPGQYEDPETGLYYNRFRYYDPEAGAYVSQDPIRLLGGWGLFSYVPDPTTWVDLCGLSGCALTQEQLLNPRLNKTHAQNVTEWRRSIKKSQIHEERDKFLGSNAIKIDKGTWRSVDGTRQFRVTESDYLGRHEIGVGAKRRAVPHCHFETLAPPNLGGTNPRLIKNVHVPLEEG